MDGPARLVSIILCAGEGRRVGGNKGLLSIDGRPLLDRLVRVTRASKIDEVLVVTGAQNEEVEELCRKLGAASAHNANWRAGMTTSIQQGIRCLPAACEAFLIHPVDHLFVRREDLDRMVAVWESRPNGEYTIVRPVFESQFGHPVLFSRTYSDEFLALDPDQPANRVYRSNIEKVTALSVLNPWTRFDLDTPEDLAQAQQIIRARGSSP